MAGKTTETLRQEAEMAWQQLKPLLHPDLVHAPRLDWRDVDPRFLRYLASDVRGMPWLNHLAFLTAIVTSHTRLDRSTIERKVYGLHSRFRVLFPRYQIRSFAEWDPGEHIPRYLEDAELADTSTMRYEFLRTYHASLRHSAAYLHALPKTEQESYQQWMFPALPGDLYHRLSRWGLLQTEQQQRRKEATDALAPHFAQMRGEAHLRWNQLKRLSDNYRGAIAQVESGQEVLPVLFSYEEPRAGMRLHFRLWDRYSFFEHHADAYLPHRRRLYERKVLAYAPEKNHFFLEFLYAERLTDGSHDGDALLWFGDLLRHDLLGHGPTAGSEAEVKQKRDYLHAWGYGDDKHEQNTYPFSAAHTGIFTGTPSQTGFLFEARKRTQGLLFLVEPLFAAATFGLAALDFLTTTGARNGELI